MASPPQPISISTTEHRPSPQYNSTSTSGGLSPLKPTSMFAATGLTHLDESDFVSQHLPAPSAPRRRRGQVSEREIETYQRWRLDISTRI